MSRRMLFSIMIFFTLISCSEDTVITPTPVAPQAVRGLYIVNEGNFQRANATLSFFVPDSSQMFNNVFESVNGRTLGDVGQSITMHKGLAYIVVNNSNRIEVIDPATHKLVKTILCPPGSSPRHIAFDSVGKGYITNLYTNSVSVYDDESNTITLSIPVGANPDGIAIVGTQVFVTNSGLGSGNTVSVISSTKLNITTTLRVGDYPTVVMSMHGGWIGVLCSGAYNNFDDPNDDTPASLIIINPATMAKVDSLPLTGHPFAFIQDDQGHVYVLENGVTRIHLSTRTYTKNFIPGWFYSGIADTGGKRLYLTNAADFVQPGSLDVYDYSGTKLASHPAGVIPGAMAFTR